jgi:formylglycine-generating enzyme required for sulfatase activity
MHHSLLPQLRIAVTITTLLAASACGHSAATGQEPPPPTRQAAEPGATSSVKTSEPMPSPGAKPEADAVATGLEHFRKQEWTRAVEHFTIAIQQSAEDPYGYWLRARSQERLGNTAEARDDYGEVVRLVDAPKDVTELRARGNAFIELGRYDDAATDLRAALSLSSNDEQSLMLLGQVCELKKDLESAVEVYTRLIKIAPNSADALLRRGNAYVQLGKYRAGMSDQKRAARLGGITDGEFLYKDLDRGTLYRFVFVPPGRYWVGYDEKQRIAVAGQARQLLFGHNATPIRDVQLREGFFILDREITVAQFEAIQRAPSKRRIPSTGKGKADLRLGVAPAKEAAQDKTPEKDNSSNLPHTDVSWIDAMKFCVAMQEQLGLVVRLPAEVEWECAARCERTWLYPWGRETGEEFPAWSDRANESPRPLNTSDNRDVTPSGIHDLGGNVSEWCLDEYHNSLFGESSARQPHTPVKVSLGNTARNQARKPRRARVPVDVFKEFVDSRRSFRGGSFKDNAFNCQVPVRRAMPASQSSSAIGFRPVLLMRFPR